MKSILFIPILSLALGKVSGQEAIRLLLREPEWSTGATLPGGIGLIGMTRQYFCLAEWNASGIGCSYRIGKGESSLLLLRDGIPCFSWYHLYISHSQMIEAVSTLLQLRFSGIWLAGQPGLLRLGGNLAIGVPAGPSTRLHLSVWDFPGFIFPRTALARGDPMIRLQAVHSPGRLLNLLWALDASPARAGSLHLGVQIRIHESLSLSALMHVLPLGCTLGLAWNTNGWNVDFRMDGGYPGGVTPTVIAERYWVKR